LATENLIWTGTLNLSQGDPHKRYCFLEWVFRQTRTNRDPARLWLFDFAQKRAVDKEGGCRLEKAASPPPHTCADLLTTVLSHSPPSPLSSRAKPRICSSTHPKQCFWCFHGSSRGASYAITHKIEKFVWSTELHIPRFARMTKDRVVWKGKDRCRGTWQLLGRQGAFSIDSNRFGCEIFEPGLIVR